MNVVNEFNLDTMRDSLGKVLIFLMKNEADEDTMKAFDYIRGTISAAILNAYMASAVEPEIQ